MPIENIGYEYKAGDHIRHLDSIVISKLNELIDSHNQFAENTIHQVNCLLKSIEKLESLAKSDSEEILCCPWCGSNGAWVSNSPHEWYVSCSAHVSDCDIHPRTDTFETKQEAIRAWNDRK